MAGTGEYEAISNLEFMRKEMGRASAQLAQLSNMRTIEKQPDYITVCDICGTALKRNVQGYCKPCLQLSDKNFSPAGANATFKDAKHNIYIKNIREETGYHYRSLNARTRD